MDAVHFAGETRDAAELNGKRSARMVQRMRVVDFAREAVLRWEPAAPYDLVCRAAALVRELMRLAGPVSLPVWEELAQAVSAEHVVSFTTHEGRPHRIPLCTWWDITNDSNFLYSLSSAPDREPSDAVGIVVGLANTLLGHCPIDEADPEYRPPIPFEEMKRGLLAYIEMLADLGRKRAAGGA
jgi:hypothetical protein